MSDRHDGFLIDDFLRTDRPVANPAGSDREEILTHLRSEVLRLRAAERKWLEGQDTLAQALARHAAENEHLKKQVQSLQDHSNVQLMEIRRLKALLAGGEKLAEDRSRNYDQDPMHHGNREPAYAALAPRKKLLRHPGQL